MKWQDIIKYGGGGAVSIFVVLALIFNLSGISVTDDGNKSCSKTCYSKIEINSTYWEIKVEHSNDKDIVYKKSVTSRTLWLNLDKIAEFVPTNPQIKVELLIPTISKYSTEKHPQYGYLRPLKDGDILIRRTTKSNPLPNKIIIKGYKEHPSQRIKWGFNLDDVLLKEINIDPIWDSTSFIVIQRIYEQGIEKEQQDYYLINESCKYYVKNDTWVSCRQEINRTIIPLNWDSNLKRLVYGEIEKVEIYK